MIHTNNKTQYLLSFGGPATILEADLFDDLNEFFTTDQYFDEEPIFNPQINVFWSRRFPIFIFRSTTDQVGRQINRERHKSKMAVYTPQKISQALGLNNSKSQFNSNTW